jgi:allophanate hydrolase
LSEVASLDFASLRAGYESGGLTPSQVASEVLRRIEAAGDDHVWISRTSAADLMQRALALEAGDRTLPLFGVPFAIKDNIDVSGYQTTAGCPAFAYTPNTTAPAVQALLDAGAMLVGKTNLDQFATGLVGVRSPYGVARNPFDARYIPGGSSAGSAVAVAAGLVSFALGTDTAGSGRVPAAFNNIVGLKPTRGLISTRGVVPACRSLDCVSVFALTVEDALDVLALAAAPDDADPFSRRAPDVPGRFGSPFRFGVPRRQLESFGNQEVERLYQSAAVALEALGGIRIEIDFEPLAEASALLYDGPWVAERTASVGDFIAVNPDAVLPVTAKIIGGGGAIDAVAVYTEHLFRQIDCLLLPTAPTIYTVDEVLADPLRTNSTLGRYTNFTNLLDLSAIALPAGFQANGLPAGVTLFAPAFREAALGDLAASLHRRTSRCLGATNASLPAVRELAYHTDRLRHLFVVGAHLSGQPLNGQLTSLGGYLVETLRTAPLYRLFALGGTPPRPGMIRVSTGGGAIEGELWALTAEALGRFMDNVRPPLAIGTVQLADGRQTNGFVCEGWATSEAEEITGYGGWRAWLAADGRSLP